MYVFVAFRMEFLRAGQAVNFGAPEKYFWLALAPVPYLYFDAAKVIIFHCGSRIFPKDYFYMFKKKFDAVMQRCSSREAIPIP